MLNQVIRFKAETATTGTTRVKHRAALSIYIHIIRANISALRSTHTHTETASHPIPSIETSVSCEENPPSYSGTMSEAIPGDAWIQSFMSTSPKPLFDQLKRRLQASTTHVTALSEVYKQRAQIESQYADSLAKLAKTAEAGGLNGKQGTEWDQSGGEAKLWNIVITDLVEVCHL